MPKNLPLVRGSGFRTQYCGCPRPSLLQCWAMADWRQIQARIRKAKAGTDAAAKLAELYEHTRDAMVAFELARWHEKAGEHAEAARWYTAAAERFRRSQWKSKAEAALARLRSPAPAGAEPAEHTEADQVAPEGATSESPAAPSSETGSADLQPGAAGSHEFEPREEPESIGNFEGAPQMADQSRQAAVAKANEDVAGKPAQDEAGRKRSHRRGNRGGRNRRRSSQRPSPGTGVTSPHVQAENSHLQAPRDKPAGGPPVPAQPIPESPATTDAAGESRSSVGSWRGRSRAGEPALASRMAQLESQLRRLLACGQAPLDEAESAPVGPGVLLLSDSDSVTHYYVESCQTLRIAIGNLVRGGRGGKDLPRLKERLAENLGIAESRVTNYLKEHCAVRWLQLDEGATELAHFAIAVLRPVVNE